MFFIKNEWLYCLAMEKNNRPVNGVMYKWSNKSQAIPPFHSRTALFAVICAAPLRAAWHRAGSAVY